MGEVQRLTQLLDEACSIAKEKYMSTELCAWWLSRCEQLDNEREEREHRFAELREQALAKLTDEEREAMRALAHFDPCENRAINRARRDHELERATRPEGAAS